MRNLSLYYVGSDSDSVGASYIDHAILPMPINRQSIFAKSGF